MRSAVWLLEVELDGRTRRWATRAVEVDTLAGETLLYEAGLSELDIAMGETGVSVELSDASVDWPALAAELQCRSATIRRWFEGDALEQAEVYTRGEVRGLEHGDRAESVTFSVEEVGGAEASLGLAVPDPLAQVHATTWPVSGGASIGDEGAFYPVIFGYPGYTGAGTVPVVPCPLGQYNAAATTYVVVAEDGLLPITGCRVRNDSLDAEAQETVVQVTDLLGRKVRCAHFSASAAPMPATSTEQRELYVGYSPGGGGGPRAAYDVIAYLLRRWGDSSVDWARLPEVRDFLAPILVDTWIDSPVEDPWAFIEGTLLTHLPLEVRRSDRGRYLVPRRYRSEPTRRVGSVDVDRGEAARLGKFTLDDSEGPYNELTALYRLGPSDNWLGRIVLTGDSTRVLSAPGVILPPAVATTQAVSVVTSGLARDSHGRYGLRQGETIEIDWTWDTGTVVRVLELLIERWAIPQRLASYEIEDGEQLKEGDEILLTEREAGIVEHPAVVDAPPRVDSTRWAAVDLRLL